MPYEAVLPVIVEPTNEEGVPYTVLYPYMPIDLGALNRFWIQLKEEMDNYWEKYHEQERKILKLTEQLHEEKGLNDYLRTKRKHPWDFGFCFSSLDLFSIYFFVTPQMHC